MVLFMSDNEDEFYYTNLMNGIIVQVCQKHLSKFTSILIDNTDMQIERVATYTQAKEHNLNGRQEELEKQKSETNCRHYSKWNEGNVLLTTHSTHFIYGYMVKDYSDSKRGNQLPPHGLLFLISSKLFL